MGGSTELLNFSLFEVDADDLRFQIETEDSRLA